MDYIRTTYIVLQIIGLVHSNQPTTYLVTPKSSLTATTEDMFILKNRIQCVLRCRQNESCYAVNIHSQGEKYVCGILGISRFLNNEFGTSTIGIYHFVYIKVTRG